MDEKLVVFVSCEGAWQAEELAGKVVGEGLAACVNVLPGVRSCYVWEGKLTWSNETLLVIKTTRARFGALQARILELHTYEVPEIIGLPIVEGFKKYLDWVEGSCR